MGRINKTVEQQEQHYKVDNIYHYMGSSKLEDLNRLYNELSEEAKNGYHNYCVNLKASETVTPNLTYNNKLARYICHVIRLKYSKDFDDPKNICLNLEQTKEVLNKITHKFCWYGNDREHQIKSLKGGRHGVCFDGQILSLIDEKAIRKVKQGKTESEKKQSRDRKGTSKETLMLKDFILNGELGDIFYTAMHDNHVQGYIVQSKKGNKIPMSKKIKTERLCAIHFGTRRVEEMVKVTIAHE